MLNNVKAFALLMLTAGLALGVFAGSLIASPKEQVLDGISRIDAAVELRLQQYDDQYQLTVLEKDQLRHEIVRYRRSLRSEVQALWRENQHKFDHINRVSEARILKILGDKAKPTPDKDTGK